MPYIETSQIFSSIECFGGLNKDSTKKTPPSSGIPRIPCLHKDLCNIRVPHLGCIFLCKQSNSFEEQEQCFIIHRKLLSLIKRMKDRKSDAIVCSANLDNASAKS